MNTATVQVVHSVVIAPRTDQGHAWTCCTCGETAGQYIGLSLQDAQSSARFHVDIAH